MPFLRPRSTVSGRPRAAAGAGSRPAALRQGLSAATVRDLGAGARFRVRVAGGSMQPALRPGDEVLAERWRLGATPAPGLGELVIVDAPAAGLVVHRLLWKDRDGIRTAGDGSRRPDPHLPHAAVMGRVLSVSRDGVPIATGGLARWVAWLSGMVSAGWRHLGRRLRPAPVADSDPAAAPGTR